MFKKTFLFLFTVMFVSGTSSLSFAMMCGGHARHQQTAQQEHAEHKHMEHEGVSEAAPQSAVNVGNKICPVSAEKIDEKLKATYEYEGKIYNFCCVSCVDEFKKDPDKYIEKVEEELKATTDEEKALMPEAKVSEFMHEGHHR